MSGPDDLDDYSDDELLDLIDALERRVGKNEPAEGNPDSNESVSRLKRIREKILFRKDRLDYIRFDRSAIREMKMPLEDIGRTQRDRERMMKTSAEEFASDDSHEAAKDSKDDDGEL